MSGWIGVDLDGTLAKNPTLQQMERGQTVGDPIVPMLERVRGWLAQGKEVKVFTARACDPSEIPSIRQWLDALDLHNVDITNAKDFGCLEIWDDIAVRVEKNTGRVL